MTLPDGSWTNATYDGLTVIKTNTLGQQTTEIHTPRGKLARSLDAENVAGSGGNRVDYTYDALGNLTQTVVSVTNGLKKTATTTFEYDIRGNKTRMTDPDMGTWNYGYNALGELTWQQDAKLQETVLTYDNLGRTVQRVEPDLTTAWTYVASGADIGRLQRVNTSTAYSKTYTYTDLGQVWTVDERIPDGTYGVPATQTTRYLTTNTYDAYGRLSSVTYPQVGQAKPVTVAYDYNDLGILYRLRDAVTNKTHWQVSKALASGTTTAQTLGGLINTSYTHDSMERLSTIASTSSTGGVLQNLSYRFDSAGNLKEREDKGQGSKETFTYDQLNRLTNTLTAVSALKSPFFPPSPR